jgi:hypothetical protein
VNTDKPLYTDVITRIVEGHPQSQIDLLMPWIYRTATDVA